MDSSLSLDQERAVGTAGNTVTQKSLSQEEHQDLEEAKTGLVTKPEGNVAVKVTE